MSGDTTIQALKRLTWLPERDAPNNGHLIGGQDYDNVLFEGGEINNVTINDAVIPQIPQEYDASVIAFGARGDGVTDDLPAFQAALAAYNSVYVPSGKTYRISNTLVLTSGKKLGGGGQTTVIKADNATYDVISITGAYNSVAYLKTENGNAGIRLYGNGVKCVQNAITDVLINLANYGLVLDGYTNTNFPCYWNNFERVLIERPKVDGVWLTKTGAGDSTNTNSFINLRVHSLGQAITGSGIYVEYGAFANVFTNPIVDLDVSASSCIRMGANSTETRLDNPYTETDGAVNNIRLESGSTGTTIINLKAASGGAAISDASGGNYISINAGSPVGNYLANIALGWNTRVSGDGISANSFIQGLTADESSFALFRNANASAGSTLQLNKSRSTTKGNQGLVQNNDLIGDVAYNASDNSAYRHAAKLRARVDGTVTNGGGITPGRVEIITADSTGTENIVTTHDSKKNFIVGTAAIATNATDGFPYIPSCAGTPTGTPTSYTGRLPLAIDSTNNLFYFYSGGSWRTSTITTPVSGANGGTGVSNSGKTITLGGNLVTSGAFNLTLTQTNTTNVTLPTTGTLATLAGSETLTNKTINGSNNTLSNTFTLTTTGSGAASYNGTTLNVPTPSSPAFTSKFTSSDQTITNGGSLTIAHGLGASPFGVVCYYINVTAEGGYSPGAEILAASVDINNNRQIQVRQDATNLYVVMGTNGQIILDTTGTSITLTNANWRLRFKAWV